ncbi:MAG TPA: SH3 domain-containing protein [Thermoanaerobaculia bacterium]|nr:SH3 domain-containing protein [Thermoanaerobaculia bacterium]
MRRLLTVLTLLVLSACAAPPAAPPVAAPDTPPPPPAAPIEERVTGTVRVTASALNVRQEPSGDAEVLTQVKKGTELGVLRSDDSWVKVRLADGTTGWVAERFVAADGGRPSAKRTQARRGGCAADSDYAFLQAPMPSFSEDGAHGLVVVEANVNAKGIVTATKLISNGTGDEAKAFLAEREIKSAKFSPPIHNCVPTAFVFTYRRSF